MLSSIIKSLDLVLFDQRCAHCREPAWEPLQYALCKICRDAIPCNDGPKCPRCALPGENRLCKKCVNTRGGFDTLVSSMLYEGPASALVLRAKFRKEERAAQALADLTVQYLDRDALPKHIDALVPIPISFRRTMQRGFNQSAIIANTLGAALHVPVKNSLRRIIHRGPQSDLPLETRRIHVHGVFKAKHTLSGTICLVDDVATSTSTLLEAANVLRNAGATRVVAITTTRCADGQDAKG